MKLTKEEFAAMMVEGAKAAVKAELDARGLSDVDRKSFGQITGVSEKEIDALDGKQKAVLFFKSIMRNDLSTLASLKAMNETTGSAGGFLVPDEFSAQVLRLVEDFGIIRKFSTVLPMGSDTLRVPRLATTVTVSFPGEATAGTASDPVFAEAVLSAKTCIGITTMSNEFLADANVNIIDIVAQIFAEAIAGAEDTQGLVGTGSPFTGILNSVGVTVLTPAAGNSTFTLCSTPDNFRDLIAQVKPWALQGACFVMHRTVWSIVQQKKASTGGDYFVSVANPVVGANAAGSPFGINSVGAIWGYPVYLSDKMPTTTAVSTKYVIFGNLKNALLGDRAGIAVDISKDATVSTSNMFERNMSAVRVIRRFAFDVGLPAAFAVLATSAT